VEKLADRRVRSIRDNELERYLDGAQVSYTLDRLQPPDRRGAADRARLAGRGEPAVLQLRPISFAAAAAAAPADLGYPPEPVKTERLGATDE
jgi:hypothetical protein